MRYLNWLTSIYLFISLINETILQSIIIRRIQTEVFQNTITSPVPSSLEGHALINIQGSGFSSITKSFACIFNSPSSNKFNYTMVVNKGQSVCAFNDYECNYQITHATLSENMIACYSPRINEADRQALLDEGGYLKLSVQVDGIPIPYTCPLAKDCLVYYHPNYTPYLHTLEPSHFYIGQNLTVKLTPKAAVTDNLIGIKLDRFNCFLGVPDGYTEIWNDLTLNCTTGGDFVVQKVTNFTVGYASGFSTIPSYFRKQDIDPTLSSFNTYFFKTFPRIDLIGPSLNGVTTGGHTLMIRGAGFAQGKTRVFIDKDECEIQKFDITILTQTIYCKVKPSTFDPQNPGLYLGSRGLRQRVFNVNTIAKMTSLPGFPNNKTNMTKEDILLETSTGPTGNNNYAQILYGYFKAIFTGQYRFWITSDDNSQVFLSNDTNPVNKTKIIDFKGWTNFLDFVSQTSATRSDWVNLTAGNYYYFEILHNQGYGGDHMRLGVEINQTSVNTTLSVLPNQIYRVLNISILPLASRDLYEFRLNLNDLYTLNYNLQDGTVKKVSFNSSISASNFRNILAAFTGESRLIIRKLGYNQNNDYYLNSSESFEDSSFTNNYNFSDMFLAAPSSGSSPANPSSNGTKTGVVFLVFIDRKASERTNKWENIYYITRTGSSARTSISLLQVVSPEVTGTFRLKVKDNTSGIELESQDLNVSNIANFQNQLELIPHFTGKISYYVPSPEVDTLTLFIKLNTYANLNITVSNNTLSGGRDPNLKPSINIVDFVPASSNLFYMPIPSDFLYVINTGPQVNVIVDGFEAVCPNNNCSYNYLPASSRPSVLSFTFNQNSNLLSITVDKGFNDSTIQPFIRIGQNIIDYTNINFSNVTQTFTCTVPQTAIGGKYIPILTTDTGDCSYPSNLTQLSLPISISNCTPTTANSLGGDVITVNGSGFPTNSDPNFSVTVGGAICRVQGINNTQFNCTLGKQVSGNSDLLTVSYNNVSVSAPDTVFKYITPPQPPNVVSVTPNNLSPGEKQFMAIKFDSNVTAFPLSGMSIKIVHDTLNTTIMLNPRNVTNNDTLFVRYGGAAPGNYTLYIKLDSVTYASGSPKIISGYTISSITPNVGSVNGGTILTIKGTNFLSTQVNQMIFIGKTTCVYLTNNNTDITCTTQGPNVNTPIDTDLPVAIDQMIQYTSICSVPKPSSVSDPLILDGCLFRYSTAKTAVINNVVSKNNDYIFEVNDTITINGANFSYAVAPTTLSFEWGKITVTTSDLNTNIVGTITQITKWGLYTFDFSNDFGISTHSPSGAAASLSKVQIFLKKPTLVVSSVSPSSPGENGAIFKFYTTATDFATSPLNKVSICGTSCAVLPTNLLTDANNTFQCVLNTPTAAANFTNCKAVVAYYGLNSELNLTNNSSISSNSLNNYNIVKVSINNVDIYSTLFTGITDSTNFQVQVQISSNNINLNLRLIVDNRYVFTATTPGVLASNNQAVYTFNINNGLPAGSFQCSIHEDSVGFLKPNNPIYLGRVATSSFLIKINIKLNAPSVNIDSSFYGGVSHSIVGYNLNKQISPSTDISTETMINNSDNSAFHNVLVCGFPAQVTQYNTRKITYLTPTLIQYNFFKDLQIFKDPEDLLSSKFSYITETVFDNSVKDPVATTATLTDGNIFTKYDIPLTSSTNIPFIGLRIKSAYQSTNLKIFLQKIKIHVGETNKPGDFNDGYIEGSLDNSTWTKLTDMPKTIPFLWYTVSINYTNINNKLYKYFRFVANSSYITSIAEIKFLGKVVYDDSTSTTALCDVNLVDNYNNMIVPNVKVRYDTAKTLVIKSVSPQNGTSIGGQTVKVTLASTFTTTSNTITSVSIFGNPVTTPITYETQSSSRILQSSNTYNTITFAMVTRNNDVFDASIGIQISISGYGNVYSNGITFKYLDRWSDTNTWGGEFIPANGETAYIKNTDVLLDVPNLNINTLVIENGSLIVEDTRDYSITARNIMVRSGSFYVGTEDAPFQHNFVLTMKSTKTDPSLPIFGNKVIAILEGNLSLQGKPRRPTWTVLSKTVFNGENTITVDGAVDWKVGEEITIASSSVIPEEAERRTIVSITGATTNSPVITLDRPLEYVHYGEIETYGTNDVIDMRAEVILLSRNIVIQGDEESVLYQYGSHMMITSMSMNMNPVFGTAPYWGKIAYAEFRRAGQAYQLGRYPIHFHMMGDVSGSYVRGCSIHDTFNRAITIHGVHNFLVEYNVIDAAMGHTMFIEDGVETNNIIRFNVIMRTRSSYSLFNTDVSPASFWITNPSNFFEGNRAAGSQFYGIWFELPPSPTGVSLGVKTCPRDYPLGMFKDNVAHSNHKYGLRIFPEYTPKSRPCTLNTDPNVVTVQAMFTSTTLYRNREKGFVTERIGNILFNGFRLADNVLQSFEVSDLIHFPQGRTTVMNMFIVGKSNNKAPVRETLRTQGFVTPRNDNYTVSDLRFYNFNNSGFALFSSCSRCEVAAPATDSDGRTIFFEKIKPDPNATMMTHWNLPKRVIYRDLDGTLTGQNGPGWVTPYYPHLLVDGACKRDPKWDDGVVCDDTVQIRRVAFFEATPNIFTGQELKILRLNSLDNVPITDLTNSSKFSAMAFKEKKDPNFGWTVAFVTGYNYLLSFGNVGLDFDSLSIERSKMWRNTDLPINFLFNYTARRDDFQINYLLNQTTFDSSTLNLVPKNTTNLTSIADINNLPLNNIPLGSFFNNVAKRHLYLRINGLNESRSSTKLTIKAIQCANNDCGIAPPMDKPAENFVRRWSNPDDWPNKKKPVDGENVEILQEWSMILDEPTAKLNTLTINGYLYFNNSVENIVLSANNILILKGKLEVGTPSDPFTKRANIQLLGDKFSFNLALSNDVKLPNKALANVGILSIFGEDRAPYKSRLLAKADKGVKKILVEKGLKWRGGDEVVIATSTWNNNQTERFTILSYSNTTGELVIAGFLNYSHYGAQSPTIFKDNPLSPLRNLDERSEVFMISRNVRISGSDEGWGCSIATTIFPTSNFTYAGKSNISNAEIFNCGQLDTEYAAMHFNKHNNKYSQSYISGVSFYGSSFSAIDIVNSKNITINNTFIFQHTKYGVSVLSSSDISINETYVIQHKVRSMPPKLKLNKITDINTCFYICPELTCTNVNFTNSTCAGSDQYGLFINTGDCGIDLSTNYNYHTTYASKIGIYYVNALSKPCNKIGNAIVYNNWGFGIGGMITSDQTFIENILSSNNLKGLALNTGTAKIGTKKLMQKVLIVGQNKENPICHTDESCVLGPTDCRQIGFILSLTITGHGLTAPFTSKIYPSDHSMGDSQFGSFFEGTNVVFANFEDQCNITQLAITSNEGASDFTSIHIFKNLTLSRVIEENLIYLNDPDPKNIGEECGDFPCSGPNNVLLRFNSFKKPNELYSSLDILPNPKWNGKRKVYVNPFVTNETLPADRPNITLTNNVTLFTEFLEGIYLDCQNLYAWNAYICPSSRSLGIMIGENLEPESRDRAIAPVRITSLDTSDPFFNKINSFKDHECENGYPSHKRTARFPGVLTLGKNYNYSTTGTFPTKFKIQIFDPDWDPNSGSNKNYSGASFMIKFTSPQTILVHNFNTGNEYKSRQWKDGEVFNETTCGANKWTPVANTLEFYVTNAPDCVLTLTTVNSVQLSLRFDITVEDFYKKDGATQLIYNIAAVLGISPDQIRITNVLKGSTIALTQILQSAPAAGATSDTATPSTSSTTSFKLLDLSNAVNVIVNGIKTGSLSIPAPILSMSYSVTVADNTTASAGNNNSSSTTGLIVSDGIIISLNALTNSTSNTSTTTTITTGGSTIIIFNNSYPYIPTNNINNNPYINPKIATPISENSNMNLLWLLVIPVFLIVAGVIGWFAYRHFRMRKIEDMIKNEMMKLPQETGRISPTRTNRKLTGDNQTENRKIITNNKKEYKNVGPAKSMVITDQIHIKKSFAPLPLQSPATSNNQSYDEDVLKFKK